MLNMIPEITGPIPALQNVAINHVKILMQTKQEPQGYQALFVSGSAGQSQSTTTCLTHPSSVSARAPPLPHFPFTGAVNGILRR